MKKIKFLFALCAACILLASCSDVPMPYLDPKKVVPSNVKTLPYTSSSLSTDWTMMYENNNPWSQGGTYTQATGYQKWDGSETKSNKEVEGVLVSPAISTKTDSNAVYLMFDYTIKYTNNVSGWEKYHKIYGTTDLSENGKLVEIPFTPEASPYTDWTLYSSGKLSLPEELVNQDSIYVLFYFYAPANASTTWELQSFEIGEGHGSDNPGPIGGSKTLPYESSNLNNDWSIQVNDGANNPWSQGGTYTLATGYQKWDGSDTKSNKDVEGYLVSPAINTTTDSSCVSFTFDYTIKYTNNVSGWEAYHKLYATTDPSDPNSYVQLTWTPEASQYTDWTLYPSGTVTLPEQFKNKESVYVLFYFYAPAAGSTTWELENFKIFAGSGKVGPDPKPVGDNLIANGDFESWNGNDAVGWKSSTTASSSGAVSQSTDAHGGNYSACLAGASAQNKRMAYKEITLLPGTYNIKFWAKSTGDKSTVNPGYVAVVDGKVSGSYVYTAYTDIPNQWTEVSKSFTLASTTTVNLVIMNPKTTGVNVLIDDYELTTSNGGIDGGDTPPTPPGPSDNSIPYSITFTSTQGDWTINDVNIATGLNYVWQQNSSYGMKASGYYQKAFDTESWLISPQFEIPTSGATMTLSHAMNYLSSMNRADCIECKVSTDKTNWTTIDLSPWPAGSDFNFVDATASLAKYAGQKIYIGFQYKSTSAGAVTYEIKSLSIK
ncbi:MAG: choice-of-anchor J domain-containing protein [Prevotellaceae bacterium]|nr:choice-of-anchor J domain-containing protein [Prevotellaceae bacterium]